MINGDTVTWMREDGWENEIVVPLPKGDVLLPVPKTKEELRAAAYILTGMVIPDKPVCEGHSCPLDAMAEAFFGEAPISIWVGARGLGGKTSSLSVLTFLEAVFFGIPCNLLGGVGEQTRRIHEFMDRFWDRESAPLYLLARDRTFYKTVMRHGGSITALGASHTRGPHPVRLRLDEVDEMRILTVDSALGQTLRAKGVPAQTVMSSTWHNPNGTMTELLRRARQRDYPVHRWCHRETVKPHGWLDPEEVERKRHEMPAKMFHVEVELGEPTQENLAMDSEAVDWSFDKDIGRYQGTLNQKVTIEPPVEGATYATGCDWAKEQNYTIMTVFRTDTDVDQPLRCVAWYRMGRVPWPQMVAAFDELVMAYPGPAAHDATGVGDVVADMMTVPAADVQLVGRARSQVFGEYIAAMENHEFWFPYIDFAYEEHRMCGWEDLHGKGHPPDSVVAGAMAYYAFRHVRPAQGRVRKLLTWT